MSVEIYRGRSLSVSEWCSHRGMSRAMFYLLRAEGKAPKTYCVGKRRYVGPTADREWLAAREAEAA